MKIGAAKVAGDKLKNDNSRVKRKSQAETPGASGGSTA